MTSGKCLESAFPLVPTKRSSLQLARLPCPNGTQRRRRSIRTQFCTLECISHNHHSSENRKAFPTPSTLTRRATFKLKVGTCFKPRKALPQGSRDLNIFRIVKCYSSWWPQVAFQTQLKSNPPVNQILSKYYFGGERFSMEQKNSIKKIRTSPKATTRKWTSLRVY